MSWTEDDDRYRLKKEADILSHGRKKLIHPDRVYEPVMGYKFDTPIELQNEFKKMWDKLSKPEMERFLNVIIASAFKNRDNKADEIDVSPFNYQF